MQQIFSIILNNLTSISNTNGTNRGKSWITTAKIHKKLMCTEVEKLKKIKSMALSIECVRLRWQNKNRQYITLSNNYKDISRSYQNIYLAHPRLYATDGIVNHLRTMRMLVVDFIDLLRALSSRGGNLISIWKKCT